MNYYNLPSFNAEEHTIVLHRNGKAAVSRKLCGNSASCHLRTMVQTVYPFPASLRGSSALLVQAELRLAYDAALPPGPSCNLAGRGQHTLEPKVLDSN